MNQQLAKPADLLLHYNYGAAAVKQWGKNTSILTNRPDIPRPPVPISAAMGSKRVKHDRNIAIQKQAAGTRQGRQGAGGKRKRAQRAAAVLEVQDGWDEDDVMLFSGVTRRRLWKGILRGSRSAQSTWRIGGLELHENDILTRVLCVLREPIGMMRCSFKLANLARWQGKYRVVIRS